MLLQTRMQVLAQPGHSASIIAVISDVAKKDGFKGFYAGLSASLLRQAIYGTARLGLYRYFSDTLKAMQEGLECMGSEARKRASELFLASP